MHGNINPGTVSSPSAQWGRNSPRIRRREQEFLDKLSAASFPETTKEHLLNSHWFFSKHYLHPEDHTRSETRRSDGSPYYVHNIEMKLHLLDCQIQDTELYDTYDAHDIVEVLRKYEISSKDAISFLSEHQVSDRVIEATLLLTRPQKREVCGSIIEDKRDLSYIDRATGYTTEPVKLQGRDIVPADYTSLVLPTKAEDVVNNVDQQLLDEGKIKSLSLKWYEAGTISRRLREYQPLEITRRQLHDNLHRSINQCHSQLEQRLGDRKTL